MVKRFALALALVVLCGLAALLGLVWMFVALVLNSSRGLRLAVAYDQLANTTFGGSEDETISSRAGKAARDGKRWGCVLCRALDWLDPNHCLNNIEVDEGKP